jgi:hypothetical protein
VDYLISATQPGEALILLDLLASANALYVRLLFDLFAARVRVTRLERVYGMRLDGSTLISQVTLVSPRYLFSNIDVICLLTISQ